MKFDIIATEMGFTEGPAWAPDGTLWHVSIPHSAIYNLTPDGTILQKVDTKGGPNGLAIDAEGTVYIAQNGGAYGGTRDTPSGIQTYRDGELRYIVEGGEPDAPNDLCFGPDGRLYFTDPRGDDGTDPENPASSRPGKLFSCNRDGSDLRMEWGGPDPHERAGIQRCRRCPVCASDDDASGDLEGAVHPRRWPGHAGTPRRCRWLARRHGDRHRRQHLGRKHPRGCAPGALAGGRPDQEGLPARALRSTG